MDIKKIRLHLSFEKLLVGQRKSFYFENYFLSWEESFQLARLGFTAMVPPVVSVGLCLSSLLYGSHDNCYRNGIFFRMWQWGTRGTQLPCLLKCGGREVEGKEN